MHTHDHASYPHSCLPAVTSPAPAACPPPPHASILLLQAMTRTGDPAELLRGPLYYVIVLLAVTGVYWRDSPVGLIITALMCALAALPAAFAHRHDG